ncbi:diacylglycerol/lipid kinase family protein [Candidatus Riflebacteria bacterium]
MSRIRYIVNPAAYGGKSLTAWDEFLQMWPGKVEEKEVQLTNEPGHARELAAVAGDYEIIVAVGGDGTVSEILSGIMALSQPRPKLAIIPAGTGNDTARNVGINSVVDSIAALQKRSKKAFDLIRVECEVNGGIVDRYGFISGNAGFSALRMLRPWMKRILGSKFAYYLSLVLGILVYHPPEMKVTCENNEYSGGIWTVLIANSERAGGNSMCVGPGALVDDGEFNVTIIPAQSRLSIFSKLPRFASGTHVDEAEISYFAAKKITVQSAPAVGLEIDGDIFGTTPATFTICPGAAVILSP